MIISTVTVVGVTGTMGANVAGIFASFGDAKVFCVGRDIEKVKRTLPRIVKSVKADAIIANLIPADYSMLEKCVAQSDLVFESTAEDLSVKTAVAKIIGQTLQQHAVSCTGTSGLSINTIASSYPDNKKKQFFGVHMFNPPYSMSLCELIPTEYSDSDIMSELKNYLNTILHRTVVEVKDTPAFLGNRIGFQFINEALQYAEKYKDSGGIDYIDSILGPFTGRSMPPLVTSDFVGLDIHKAIVDNIYNNTEDYAHQTFLLPTFAEKLISENRLGRKTGGGLYQLVRYENGLKRQTVYDINTGLYRDVIPYAFPFAVEMKKRISVGDYQRAFQELINNHSLEAKICLEFLLKYIVYSIYTAKEVGYNIEAADDVMATGFNWCPPLALLQALSAVSDVRLLICDRLPELKEKYDIETITDSKYDYRQFLRSGR